MNGEGDGGVDPVKLCQIGGTVSELVVHGIGFMFHIKSPAFAVALIIQKLPQRFGDGSFCRKFSARIKNKYLVYTKDMRKEEDILYLPAYMTCLLYTSVKQYWNGTIKISSITMHGVWQWTVCSAVSRPPIQQSASIVCAVF